jgi:hypothetical protein
MVGRSAPAQDSLAVARTLYASARYDEALDLLDRLRFEAAGSPTDALALEKHRALCLLALGREGEAESAFAGVVAVDPSYLPDTREVAPSVRLFFRDVRRRMLPGIVRARYVEAKGAYDRHEYETAAGRFREVSALLADQDMEPGHDDLCELVAGFEELSRAKADEMLRDAEDTEPSPPAAADPVPASVPDIYGPESPGVMRPVTLAQEIPPLPADSRLPGRSRGVIEVVIDEQGRVASVVLRQPIHETYDRRLIEAAIQWRYEPARADGKAVKYRKTIEVRTR